MKINILTTFSIAFVYWIIKTQISIFLCVKEGDEWKERGKF